MNEPHAGTPRLGDTLSVLEAKLGSLARSCKLLPAITAANAAEERRRLCAALEADESVTPRFAYRTAPPALPSIRELDALRALAREVPGSALYLAKLEELELDVAILAALGDGRRLRPLVARRFGTGDELVHTGAREETLCDYARRLIASHPPRSEARVLPALTRDGTPSLAALIHAVAARVGLEVEVRVEPNLAAGAAAGDRTVYVADRSFGMREALRLAVHEVLGHLTAAANARLQPIRLPELGTAESFADQEGAALCIEQAFDVLDGGRLRALAARVLATNLMHAGASFADCARTLLHVHGFTAGDAIAISERAYRGGGVARDAGYLRGYLRVRAAIDSGAATLDELRLGRVGVTALPELRELAKLGLIREPRYRALGLDAAATSGTSREASSRPGLEPSPADRRPARRPL